MLKIKISAADARLFPVDVNRRSLSLVLCCIFAMAVEMVINSWFVYGTDVTGNNMIKKSWQQTDFKSV